jgi:hypothetical protein
MSNQTLEAKQYSWDIAKLLELGVDEAWLSSVNPTPQQARELVKGLLYVREWAKSEPEI